MGRAGATGNVNLDIAAQTSSEGGNTVYINRTYNSAGSDDREVGVCTGVVFEISHEQGTGLGV
jgi:hypothetical protein